MDWSGKGLQDLAQRIHEGQRTEAWLKAMAALGVQDIRVYNTSNYAVSVEVLLEIDDMLTAFRSRLGELEMDVPDMHPWYDLLTYMRSAYGCSLPELRRIVEASANLRDVCAYRSD